MTHDVDSGCDRPALKITPETIDALCRGGLVIVPIKPTAEMLDAAFDPVHGENAEGTWEAMIGAAPNPLEAENQDP